MKDFLDIKEVANMQRLENAYDLEKSPSFFISFPN
jgi:hypothetical protein